MKQALIKAYMLKRKGVLRAAEGGEVPDDGGYWDSDVSQWVVPPPADAPSDPVAATVSAEPDTPEPPAPPPEAAAPEEPDASEVADPPAPATPDKAAAVKDYVQGKYADAADDSGVKAALAESKRQNLIANLGDAATQVATARGAANGMQHDDGSFWQGIKAQGEHGVAQAAAERQGKIQAFLQRNDLQRQVASDQLKSNDEARKAQAHEWTVAYQTPGSAVSTARGAAMAKMFPDEMKGIDTSVLSAADMDAISKQVDVKARTNLAREAVAARLQAAKDAKAARDQHAGEVSDAKAEKSLDEAERRMSEAMDPNRARSGLKADNQKRLNNAARASALIYDDSGKILNLNPEQQGEAAQAWAAMIGNGSVTADAAVTRLLPHTASGQIADVKQWLTSEPHGADQQAFTQMMADSIKRERDVAERLLRESQVQAASGFSALKAKRPDAYNRQLRAAGIDPADVDANGQYKPRPKEADVGESPAVQEVERVTADGKTAIFDAATKKFLRYK